MRLPLIKQLVNFAHNNDSDYLTETLELLEDFVNARGLKEEELDTLGELMSNLHGALEVLKSINSGSTQKDALNEFMKKVSNIGNGKH